MLLTTNSREAPGVRPKKNVEAGYVITPVLGALVTMKPSNRSTNVRNYDGSAKFGLRQAYGEQPGRFLPFLEISFTSQGNLQADQAVVQSLFLLMQMNVYYKHPK